MNPKKYITFLVVFITLLACAPAFAATYTHDNANRLTSIDYGDGTTITYTYDANGNMTSM
ncbi:MAG: RHS repeat protein, partial [Deltaproteobacteria bacterium]|nr:RHS repeat protein [Deltaproteobacteria bacterium]